MGFFDRLKSRFSQKKEPLAPLAEADVADWLGGERAQLDERLKHTRLEFGSDLTKKIQHLQALVVELKAQDLSDKQEHDRVKHIVLDNKATYEANLDRLLKELTTLQEEDDPEALAISLGQALGQFSQKTAKNHDRANYLIGKEIVAIESALKDLFSMTSALLKDKDSLFTQVRALESLRDSQEALKEKEEVVQQSKQTLTSLVGQADTLRASLEHTERELSALRASEAYKAEVAKRKARETLQSQIHQDITQLQQSINFKELARAYHSMEQRMDQVKALRERFRQEFSSQSDTALMEFLDILPNHKELVVQIKAIRDQEARLADLPVPQELDKSLVQDLADIHASLSDIASQQATLGIRSKELEAELKDEHKQFELDVHSYREQYA